MQKKIRVLLLLIVLFVFICFLVDFSDVRKSLAAISFGSIFLALLLYLVFFLLNAKVLVALLKAMGFRVSLSGCLGVNQFSSLFNYVAPFRVGQIAVKAVLMKSMFNVSISASSIGFLAVSFLSILVSLLLFLISSFLLGDDYFWNSYSGLVFLCVSIFALTILGLWIARTKLVVHDRVLKLLKLISGFSVGLVLLCIFLLTAQVIISALITVVFLEGVGVDVDLVTAIFLSSVGNITLLVSVTPGNVGVKELTFLGVGILLGVPESPMLSVLIIDRLLQIVISSIFSAFLFYRHGDFVLKALRAGR